MSRLRSMIEWSDTHKAIFDMVRRFIDAELKPNLRELEHGDMPPYDILRKMFATFGLRDMATMRAEKAIARARAREEARARGEQPEEKERRESGDQLAMQMISIV